MSYAEALERLKKIQDGPGEAVPKVTEAPYGTYGTPAPGPSENFNRASGTSDSCQPGGGNEARAADEISQTPAPGTAKSAETMPAFEALLPACRDACRDTHYVEAQELARWLIAQGDPDWCRPVCVKWWASYIDRRGWPED